MSKAQVNINDVGDIKQKETELLNVNEKEASEACLEQEPYNPIEDIELRGATPDSDAMPHYYPQEHEMTRWLINQIRSRNGLHYLVNVVNSKPDILSSHFEVLDQPNFYSDVRNNSEMPAYSVKTTLYLTPLAIAVYFKLKTVIRLLLDVTGTRINLKARKHVDINAICYIKRDKPVIENQVLFDEYCTTIPAILAIRREFYNGISLLMVSGFHPQAPFTISEYLCTPRQTNIVYNDILEYAIRLMSTRPGLDIMNFLQTISYRVATSFDRTIDFPFYDLSVYEVQEHVSKITGKKNIAWCSLFRRVVKRGVAKVATNCASRLLSVLEEIVACGFFRQSIMVHGVHERVHYTFNEHSSALAGRKFSPEDIAALTLEEREAAKNGIGDDRDALLVILLVWIVRVLNKCLLVQRQRLLRLLTTILYDTDLLSNFINAPQDVDTETNIWPPWLSTVSYKYLPVGVYDTKNFGRSAGETGVECTVDTPVNFPIELPQLNQIRGEVVIFAQALKFIEKTTRQTLYHGKMVAPKSVYQADKEFKEAINKMEDEATTNEVAQSGELFRRGSPVNIDESADQQVSSSPEDNKSTCGAHNSAQRSEQTVATRKLSSSKQSTSSTTNRMGSRNSDNSNVKTRSNMHQSNSNNKNSGKTPLIVERIVGTSKPSTTL